MEPFHDYRNIINSLRTDFGYWVIHRLTASFIAQQPTSISLAYYSLARQLYPLLGMPLIP
jgi:hypothetical protein